MKRVLVTGASGFLGGLLARRLSDAGLALNLASRTARASDAGMRHSAVGEVGPRTDWRPALEDCDAVVHLAAQVPMAGVEDEAFDQVNDQGTARLAEQAAASGVRLFVLMSSLAAVTDNWAKSPVGEQTSPNPT